MINFLSIALLFKRVAFCELICFPESACKKIYESQYLRWSDYLNKWRDKHYTVINIYSKSFYFVVVSCTQKICAVSYILGQLCLGLHYYFILLISMHNIHYISFSLYKFMKYMHNKRLNKENLTMSSELYLEGPKKA